MASRFEIVDEGYIEELNGKSTDCLEERFQKVGGWKKLSSEFRRVRERCPRPNGSCLDQTLSQLYAELRKENGDDY